MLTYRELARRRARWNAAHGLGAYMSQDGGYTYDPNAPGGYNDPSYYPTDNPVPDASGYITSTSPSYSGSGGGFNFGSLLSSLFGSGGQSYNPSQGAPVNPVTPTSYSGVTNPNAGTPAPAAPPSAFMANLTNFSTPYPYLALGGLLVVLAVMKRGGGGGATIIKS